MVQEASDENNSEDASGQGLLLQNFYAATHVTRLGDLLDFGQLFKAFGNN